MNDRIKELYEQSLIREMSKDHAGNPMMVIKQNPEKFAELIVAECIDSVLDSSVEYTTRPQVASEIREHFGVE